jgi:hypothetical protein
MYLTVLQLINYYKYTIKGRAGQGNPRKYPPFSSSSLSTKSTRQGAMSHDSIHVSIGVVVPFYGYGKE